MPEAIIRDPKMNPRERAFGILYVPELKFNLKYFKQADSDARGMPAGTLVKLKEYKVCFYPVRRVFDGIPVHGYTKESLFYDEKLNEDKAPVIHAMIKKLGGINEIIRIIEDLIQQGRLKSDIEYPEKKQ